MVNIRLCCSYSQRILVNISERYEWAAGYGRCAISHPHNCFPRRPRTAQWEVVAAKTNLVKTRFEISTNCYCLRLGYMFISMGRPLPPGAAHSLFPKAFQSMSRRLYLEGQPRSKNSGKATDRATRRHCASFSPRCVAAHGCPSASFRAQTRATRHNGVRSRSSSAQRAARVMVQGAACAAHERIARRAPGAIGPLADH